MVASLGHLSPSYGCIYIFLNVLVFILMGLRMGLFDLAS